MGVGSPFTDSTPDRASCRPVGWWVWVWLGGTLLLLGSGREERARTLLGPEETPVWCVLGAAPGSAVPNASVVFVVAVWFLGCGCVLSVA